MSLKGVSSGLILCLPYKKPLSSDRTNVPTRINKAFPYPRTDQSSHPPSDRHFVSTEVFLQVQSVLAFLFSSLGNILCLRLFYVYNLIQHVSVL